MKKLMIAAAAVAMIGAAEAATGDAKYRFSAYLTTTTSAGAETAAIPGTSDTKAYSLQAGPNAARTMYWYQDPAISNAYFTASPAFANVKWTTVGSGAFAHPTLQIVSADGSVTTNEHAFLTQPAWTNYDPKVTKELCLDISWVVKTTTPGTPGSQVCYRVASGEEIATDVYLPTNCCTATRQFTNADGAINFGAGLLNRFGAPVVEDAWNVEIFAIVTGIKTESYRAWDMFANKEVDRGGRPFWGALAGQGWCLDLDAGRFPDNVSGNIVGYLPPEKCGCCLLTLPGAIAFDCMKSTVADDTLATAAYGWFYLQYLGIAE